VITHLVDSDVSIDFLNQNPAANDRLVPLMKSGSLAISVIVLAELREGVLGSRDPETAAAKLEDFLAAVDVLTIERSTAGVFAELRQMLRRRGEPIADHDLWIASTVLEHRLTLVSNDHHFDRIPDLKRG
jgi:tRNA(fMet)-specific endonuclease VapC